jgi:hypothetical protein
LRWGVEELKANSPMARSRAEIDQGVPATAEGGRRPLRKFGEVARSVESMKSRERRLGGVASTIRSSVEYSRRPRCLAAADCLRGGSRRRFSAETARRLALGLDRGLGEGRARI